jgi:tetratricopeptide (TPR) repeat protein
VQHAIWGFDPLPYHLVNIAMHTTCAILLWQVLRRLNVRAAWLGAALWALHPVQVESVAWITELKNTQSCFFYLLTVLFFLKWQASGASGGRSRAEGHFVLALLCAALAITSKTSTVMLPVVLGLCWWWLDRRWRWRNLVRLAPFLLISAVASVWTIWDQKHHIGARGPDWAQSWPERAVNAGRIIWFYLGKLLWPHPLIFIYPRWTIDASHLVAYLPVLAAIFMLFVLWLNRNGRPRPVFFAFAYFLVSLFPVLGFFNVYFFRYSFVGDHFQYLASMGPVVAAAAGLSGLCGLFKPRHPFLEPALGGALLAILGMLTWRECGTYADSETLWRNTIAKNPNACLAYNNLGTLQSEKGQVDEAVADFNKALEINPGFFEAHNNLGKELLRAGQVDEAMDHFSRAVELAPTSAVSHYNLGDALLRKGQLDAAIVQFQKAVEIQADSPEAHNNLGIALMRSGRLAEALEHYQIALAINPASAISHYNLGGTLLRMGQLDEAIVQFRKAVEIQPDYPEAHNYLGSTLAQKGLVDEAIAQFKETLRFKPDDPDAKKQLRAFGVPVPE